MPKPVHGGHLSMRLLGEPRDVHVARAFVRRILLEYGVDRRGDDVVAVASELVTNAVMHGRGPVQLHVELADADVLVGVADTNPAVPTQRVAAQEEESGRGLAIVAALSTRWWVESGATGKTTFASVPLASTVDATGGLSGRSRGRPGAQRDR